MTKSDPHPPFQPGPMLTSEEIEEFRELVRKECRIDMTYNEAAVRAPLLIHLYRMLMGPIPEDPHRLDEANTVDKLSIYDTSPHQEGSARSL
jgi:hypothetical protein